MSEDPGTKPERSSFDKAAELAADLFVYVPVGLTRQLAKRLPDLAKSGREALQTPLTAAKVMGKYTVDQQRRDLGEKLRQATEPYFGGKSDETRSATESESAVVVDIHSKTSASATEDAASTTSGAVDPATTSAPPVTSEVPDPELLPIEGYETLSASHVLAHLDSLDIAGLTAVEAYEKATRARKTVLAHITQLRSQL